MSSPGAASTAPADAAGTTAAAGSLMGATTSAAAGATAPADGAGAAGAGAASTGAVTTGAEFFAAESGTPESSTGTAERPPRADDAAAPPSLSLADIGARGPRCPTEEEDEEESLGAEEPAPLSDCRAPPVSPESAAATPAPEIRADPNPTRTALVPSRLRRSTIAFCLPCDDLANATATPAWQPSIRPSPSAASRIGQRDCLSREIQSP